MITRHKLPATSRSSLAFPGQTLTGGYNPLGQASAPQTIGDYALPSNTSYCPHCTAKFK